MYKHIICFIVAVALASFRSGMSGSGNDFAEFEDPDDVSADQFFSNKPSVNDPENKAAHTDDDVSASPGSNNGMNSRSSKSADETHQRLPDSAKQDGDVESSHPHQSSTEEFGDQESQNTNEDGHVETDAEDEMSQFQDSEEFEGFDSDREDAANASATDSSAASRPAGGGAKPDIKIAKVPHHLTAGWERYVFEMVMLGGLVVYMLAFLVGKSKNQRLAEAWLAAHRDLLDLNFSLVGDDGANNPNSGQLNKEAEHLYNLWCSGRVCVEGMLVELKLLKRQDLISVISNWFKPSHDQIVFTVHIEPGEMEGFVMAIAQKRRVNRLLKDFSDLSFFCPEKRSLPRSGIPDSFTMLSEIAEASLTLLDTTVCKMLEDFEDQIEYIHISDQFTGKKSSVEPDSPQITPEPKLEKVLIVGIKVGKKGHMNISQIEATRPILKFVFYLLERVRKIKLSKEAKSKSEKNRRKALEQFQRQLHSQRQEAAQQRREEKRRVEKERLLSEEDPDKARKLEEREFKKEAKRNQPKAKLLKVKGM